MNNRFSELVRTLPEIKSLDDIRTIEETPLEQYELPESTFALIEDSAQQYPDNTALRFLFTGKADEQGVAYSYSEFLHKIRQTANAFSSLGIGSDDVVSFLLPSLPQTHFTLWGGEAAGIVNPINPLLEPEHIAGIMNGAGTRVLVAAAPFPGLDFWDKVEQIREKIPTLEKVLYVDLCQFLPKAQAEQVRSALPLKTHDWCEDFDAFIGRFPGNELQFERTISANDTASLFHTGGTTGTPKLAPHTHRNEVTNAAMMQMVLRHDDSSVLLCGLPLFHVNAVVVTGLLPLLNGGEILLATPAGYRNQDLMQNFWKLVERHKVSFFSAVPAIYAGLLQLPVGDADITSLKNVLSGGSAMPVAVHEAFEALTKVPLIEGFGMTEGTCGSATNPPAGERRTGSIGLPLPYTDVRVVQLDEAGQLQRDCQVEETGTLLIRGPNVFKGYTDPSKNTDIWIDGDWFNTGDLARRDADGYVWLTGRAKDLIIRGGHNIDPQMIEDILYQHPAVEMAAAVGKPCDRVGELPVAYVTLKSGTEATAEELINYCAEHIPERAAVPKNIWIIDEIPHTAVGKVFKPDLRRDAIRRVIEERLGEKLPQDAFRVEVTPCKQHGQRADVFINRALAERQDEIASELANYTFHSTFHISE
ncbi:acyl-CoA synthetase [Microbulbifer litoralis]|uniref:acyl-CoA synthetase n=1 Tax=Microbulbifer litoralis TaxID=2933965 RepID=UPI0020298A1F|nr:acyl-CoA synthetase [Microbulbifer sp. GX H0434]